VPAKNRGFEARIMIKTVISIVLAASVLSCSTVITKDISDNNGEITERKLWRMHKDIRYTIFIYDDSTTREGLLLRWKPDSILVQPRGAGMPVRIPSAGITAVRIEVGNRMPEWVAGSVLAAGAYVALMKSYELTSASQAEGVAKLLGPPLIIIAAMGIGSGMNKYEEYKVPEGFEFDFDKADVFYKALE